MTGGIGGERLLTSVGLGRTFITFSWEITKHKQGQYWFDFISTLMMWRGEGS